MKIWYYILQVDSEEENLPDEKFVEELAKRLPQGTDKTPEVLSTALEGLPDRWVFYKIIIINQFNNNHF